MLLLLSAWMLVEQLKWGLLMLWVWGTTRLGICTKVPCQSASGNIWQWCFSHLLHWGFNCLGAGGLRNWMPLQSFCRGPWGSHLWAVFLEISFIWGEKTPCNQKSQTRWKGYIYICTYMMEIWGRENEGHGCHGVPLLYLGQGSFGREVPQEEAGNLTKSRQFNWNNSLRLFQHTFGTHP